MSGYSLLGRWGDTCLIETWIFGKEGYLERWVMSAFEQVDGKVFLIPSERDRASPFEIL